MREWLKGWLGWKLAVVTHLPLNSESRSQLYNYVRFQSLVASVSFLVERDDVLASSHRRFDITACFNNDFSDAYCDHRLFRLSIFRRKRVCSDYLMPPSQISLMHVSAMALLTC